MDWKHILSLNPLQIDDEQKDELLNTIAWHDFSTEERLDAKRYNAVLQISQEILKYKSEQVDVLLSELDEIAKKQAEEEDSEEFSVKSKKSSDLIAQDTSYVELKNKYKKLLKVVESQKQDNNKLDQRVKMLEKERVHLQNELRAVHHDDSASDISEIVKDQQKGLMESVQQKNAQISQLLMDIENVESDNLGLRTKLNVVTEKLEEGTEKLETLLADNKVLAVKVEEHSDLNDTLQKEIESLKGQIEDLVEERKTREDEFESFSREIDLRIEDWKKILDSKNQEILNLKSQTPVVQSGHSSVSSSPSLEKDKTQLEVLQDVIADRERHISQLTQKLDKATKEMLKSTEILKATSSENESLQKRNEKVHRLLKEMKKQLKNCHGRAQNLQEDLKYQECLVEIKDNDIQKIINKIEDPNFKALIKELDDQKNEKRFADKKISDLVKKYNKIQTIHEKLLKENEALRNRLELSEDDFISTHTVTIQHKKQKKQLKELTAKIDSHEEEVLQYRLEIQKLNKIIANLSDQVIELGETPQVDSSVLRAVHKDSPVESIRDDYDVILSENEALRKGLHEILDSIHNKQEGTAKIIESETLEQLLRALDVKHISGWYHPAMRLQAELHTVEGNNAALREQLRITREELETLKEKPELNHSNGETANESVLVNLNNRLVNILQNCKSDGDDNVIAERLQSYQREFCSIQEQVSSLYTQYMEEKENFEQEIRHSNKLIDELKENCSSFEEQLKTIDLFNDPQTEAEEKIKKAAEMSALIVKLNRKNVYWEQQDAVLRDEISKLRLQVQKCDEINAEKSRKMKEEFNLLASQAKKPTRIVPSGLLKLQNDYENLLVKQRELLKLVSDIQDARGNELEQLKKKIAVLEGEKQELCAALTSNAISSSMAELQQKLAQSEINEMTERQRANHSNSLYELVKDQLGKSEDRFKEFQKYNNEIVNKNLLLQESLRELEDRVGGNYVDAKLVEALQDEMVLLQDECARERAANERLRDEMRAMKKDEATKALLCNLDQYEVHNLRHQIVDLQATSDDKSVIARLSSDVVVARMAEMEIRKRLDEATVELADRQSMHEKQCRVISKEMAELKLQQESRDRKINYLEMIIRENRKNFAGYVPYISEMKLVERIKQSFEDRKLAGENLQKVEELENECRVIKETLEMKTDILNELNDAISRGQDEQSKALERWFLEKTNLQLQELRSRREAKFKESQLANALKRIELQDEQLGKLERELLESLSIRETIKSPVSKENGEKKGVERKLQVSPTKLCEIQPVAKDSRDRHTQSDSHVFSDANKKDTDMPLKDNMKADTESMRKGIDELEKLNASLRQQIVDKQSQITFYEKRIIDLQKSVEKKGSEQQQQYQQQNNNVASNELLMRELQGVRDGKLEKEKVIMELQALLKKDRDEHSLAAARFQEEFKQLQAKLFQQELETQKSKPARAAVEYYIQQVHSLEKHAADLQTSVSTLGSQLQSTREECVRWRCLADERLQSVDKLRIQLEQQHNNELQMYKSECEKWRSEVNQMQEYINTYKNDIADLRPNIEKELKDKDAKIHELLVTIRQLKSEVRRKSNIVQMSTARSNEDNLEETKEHLLKEQDNLRRRCEVLLTKERSARDEIRTLREQLTKRPLLSSRSDSSTHSKGQLALQRKVQMLEREVEDLKEKLQRECAYNEAHKLKINSDFDKWSKQKYWQQNSEKLKRKLKEKSDECDKMQATCASYKGIVERLEREKHNLEIRVKNLKSSGAGGNSRLQLLESDNGKLRAEINVLRGKLDTQQHHSGALSALMLQDKLEAQERKIAVLEMSAKGSGELRSELERQQSSNAKLQKSNLLLETENLDLRLDLEKSSNELPHLREQINYLESYIEVLKREKPEHEVNSSGDHLGADSKRVSELERTVFVLKRIVEKLQVENKRLVGGSRPCSAERSNGSGDRWRRECVRLKEQISQLERELGKANEKLKSSSAAHLQAEMDRLREQLEQKTELLEKVKVLLQRAAAKEKALTEQVSSLKAMIESKQ